MPEHQHQPAAPSIIVSLAIDAALRRAHDSSDPLHEALHQRLSTEVESLRQTLGIPGAVLVQVMALDSSVPGRFLRITVNDKPCRYSNELLRRIHSYVCEIPAGAQKEPSQLLTWLTELSGEKSEQATQRFVEFLSLICLEAIKQQPAVLLGSAHAAAYLAALPDFTEEEKAAMPEPEFWRFVFAETLRMKISLADQTLVIQTMKKILAHGRSREEAAEDLIVALRPDVVEIQFPPDDLRRFTMTEAKDARDFFALMRDGLFYELGLPYPSFRFVPVAHLKPGSFAFRINHLTTIPWIGLPSDQVLVNETPERMNLYGIQGQAAVNPANANDSGLIDIDSRQRAEEFSLTTWDHRGYLILCFSANLRESSAWFYSRQTAQAHLRQQERSFPALVKSVQSRFTIEQITRVLRSLLAEEISVRDLRSILESLANFDFIVADSLRHIIFDDRLPLREQPSDAAINDTIHLTAFVRSRMKRYISHKYTRGQSSLMVYLLDPAIEVMLASTNKHARLSEREQSQILDAIRTEWRAAPPFVSSPAILTTIEVRTLLREVLAMEFPRLPILAYQELSPELNIQPLARIQLSA